jgi:hypothetical protein
MLLFETYRTAAGASRWKVRLFRRMQDKVRNKLTKGQYENEVSWSMVDVDVAHAAGTAPFGGGVHSFGVGDRDRDAARWGWGRAARRPPLMFVLLDIRLPACLLVSVCLDFPPTSREIPPFSIFLSLYLSLPIYLSISVPRTFRAAPSLI